jgi:heat-inducible transcriptional repressor
MREKDLSVADEVSVKERIWANRDQLHDLLSEVARVMAERANCIGVVISEEGNRVFSSGYAHLLTFPEFTNIDVTRTVLTLVEEVRALQEIIQFSRGEETIHLVMGEDLGNEYLAPVSFIFTDLASASGRITLGTVGPMRIDYSYVIPMIKYFRSLVYELVA